MERAEVLILKLLEQFRKKEDITLLQASMQQIQDELSLQPVSQPRILDKGKVSIVLPFRHKPDVQQDKPVVEEKVIQMLQVDEQEVEKELEMIKQAADLRTEMNAKLRPPRLEVERPAEQAPLPDHPQALSSEPQDIDDIPTLAAHMLPPTADSVPPPDTPTIQSPAATEQPGPDTVQPPARELNEKLREPLKEVAQKLQDVPIRDLRKAIGINDRYLFINELFSGDEAMFERSVKTLNQFSILPEAEFWMQRELRIKLGWKDDNPLVRQFVQLVRRRFS
jgi:hypothetical protein